MSLKSIEERIRTFSFGKIKETVFFFLPSMRKTKKTIKLFFLFVPPLVLSVYWFQIEKSTYYPFPSFQMIGESTFTPEGIQQITELTQALYEQTKNDFPVRFEEAQPVSQLTDFESKVSESITEKLGIFSILPYHTICLVNKNEIYIGEALDNNQAPNMGGLDIRQSDGFELYAPRGGKSCKNGQIGKFRTSSSTVEIGHPMTYLLTQEENSKRMSGEPYETSFAPTVINMANTSLEVSLRYWVVVLGYLLLLFAWSFIFFQFEKIAVYVKEEVIK